ncbi:TetR/AcrR family transcriptional regulator [Streptomyces sp. ACA25]|uniref:TetR/AcrR family transcriptional regulator n=1 Tax=Streptomyces sp. ACA25 TaxID=3022596 RepID=UPI002307201D|nr:TetR/AcrR family transcriptional regulator [Streptomyces sp. ACA25]MDB1087138.1 TetR/AcrR family transcriptional regulator [Streptomyces sp. ACA25]
MSSYARLRSSALELFATRGFQATGIRDLAAGAGVSLATIYHYMDRKEDLLVRLMRESLERLNADARTVLAQVHTPVERLAALTLMHVLAHGLRRTETVVVDRELRSLGPENRESVVSLRDEYEEMWGRQLVEGAASDTMSVPDVRVTRLALLAMCTGVAYWYSDKGQLSQEQVAALHTDLVLAQTDARQDGHRVRLADLNLPPIAWFRDLVVREDG